MTPVLPIWGPAPAAPAPSSENATPTTAAGCEPSQGSFHDLVQRTADRPLARGAEEDVETDAGAAEAAAAIASVPSVPLVPVPQAWTAADWPADPGTAPSDAAPDGTVAGIPGQPSLPLTPGPVLMADAIADATTPRSSALPPGQIQPAGEAEPDAGSAALPSGSPARLAEAQVSAAAFPGTPAQSPHASDRTAAPEGTAVMGDPKQTHPIEVPGPAAGTRERGGPEDPLPPARLPALASAHPAAPRGHAAGALLLQGGAEARPGNDAIPRVAAAFQPAQPQPGGEDALSIAVAPGMILRAAAEAPDGAGIAPHAPALVAARERVTAELAALIHIGGGHAEIDLTPPELGRVRLRLAVRNRTVQGSIEVENAAVKQVLETSMDRLQVALERHGLNFERLDVRLQDSRRGQERHEPPARPPHREAPEDGERPGSGAGGRPPQPRHAGSGLVDYWL